MADEAIKLGGKKKSKFIDQVKELLPEGGNLNLCLTCGACSSGCPATGLEDMDPRKFLRMAALGMDEEILSSEWAWCCTLCMRCIYVCPMKIDIPQLVFNVRKSVPRDEKPKGILGSCDMALRNDTCSAMGERNPARVSLTIMLFRSSSFCGNTNAATGPTAVATFTIVLLLESSASPDSAPTRRRTGSSKFIVSTVPPRTSTKTAAADNQTTKCRSIASLVENSSICSIKDCIFYTSMRMMRRIQAIPMTPEMAP